MSQINAISRSELEEILRRLNMDLYTTGRAARTAKVDRRTFISWAKKMGIKPFSVLDGGKKIYLKEDVQKIADEIKLNQK